MLQLKDLKESGTGTPAGSPTRSGQGGVGQQRAISGDKNGRPESARDERAGVELDGHTQQESTT